MEDKNIAGIHENSLLPFRGKKVVIELFLKKSDNDSS